MTGFKAFQLPTFLYLGVAERLARLLSVLVVTSSNLVGSIERSDLEPTLPKTVGPVLRSKAPSVH